MDIDDAFRASPLFQEMDAIASADDHARFESSAKRQHFVPRFLLARFAFTARGKETVAQLNVETGESFEVATVAAASKRHFYALVDEDGARSNRIEGFLSLVETHAAPALERFLPAPEELTPGDRATLAFLFALQDVRTPVAAQRMAGAVDTITRLMLANESNDLLKFRRQYRELFGDAPDDEIERFRHQVRQQLHDGSLSFANERAIALDAGLGRAATLATVIFEMDWQLLVKPDSFVTSDRGLAMYDPEPAFPFAAQSWRSSPGAETIIPLSSSAVLLLRPRGFGTYVQEVDDEGAVILNRRTLGWADTYIFGKTDDLVRAVWDEAIKHPDKVVRPKPRAQLMLFEADPADPTVADENEARGWPRYITENGVEYDYAVILHGATSLQVAAEIDRKIEERVRRKFGIPDGKPLPSGRMTIDPLNPETLFG